MGMCWTSGATMASEMLALSTPIQHSCVGVDNTDTTRDGWSIQNKFIKITKLVIIV